MAQASVIRVLFRSAFPSITIMSLPKQGDSVKVVLRSGETVEGTVEWLDGNGAWIKNPERSRWVPIEVFLMPPAQPESKKDSASEE